MAENLMERAVLVITPKAVKRLSFLDDSVNFRAVTMLGMKYVHAPSQWGQIDLFPGSIELKQLSSLQIHDAHFLNGAPKVQVVSCGDGVRRQNQRFWLVDKSAPLGTRKGQVVDHQMIQISVGRKDVNFKG